MTSPLPSTAYERDPVSVLFDTGARRLLQRAYAARGHWQGTRIASPSPELARRLLAVYGIRWDGPDNAPTASGRRQNARSRYGRGFVRCCHWLNKNEFGGGPLEVEVGRALPVQGLIPAGRAVRVRIRGGGQRQAKAAAKRKPLSERIWADDQGTPGARWSDAEGRDW